MEDVLYDCDISVIVGKWLAGPTTAVSTRHGIQVQLFLQKGFPSRVN